MACVVGLEMEFGRNIEGAGAGNRLEQAQQRINIGAGEEWLAVGGVAVSGATLGAFGIFFLEVTGVLQGNGGEINSGLIGENGPVVAIANQNGQPATVVQMGVG